MKNLLKIELLEELINGDYKLISFENTNSDRPNLDTSRVKVTLQSNVAVKHELLFDYHLKLIEVTVVGDCSKLTESSFNEVSKLIGFCKKRRRLAGLAI